MSDERKPTIDEIRARRKRCIEIVEETHRALEAGFTPMAEEDADYFLESEELFRSFAPQIIDTLLALLDERTAERDALSAQVERLERLAQAALSEFTFLVGEEPNILVSGAGSGGQMTAIGLVGDTAEAVRGLQRFLLQRASDRMAQQIEDLRKAQEAQHD